MPVSAESSPDSKLGQEPAVVDAVEVTTTTATGSPRVVVSKDESIIDVALTQQQAQEHRQWHEDRIRRRLLNEYEQRGRALSEIVCRRLGKLSYRINPKKLMNLLPVLSFDFFTDVVCRYPTTSTLLYA